MDGDVVDVPTAKMTCVNILIKKSQKWVRLITVAATWCDFRPVAPSTQTEAAPTPEV